jgi:hypothetical protein
MARGRPKKCPRNTAGLQNQAPHRESSLESDDTIPNKKRKSPMPAIHHEGSSDEEALWDVMGWDGDNSDLEVVEDGEEFGDAEFERKMVELALRDDPNGNEWLPHSAKPGAKNVGE